jgi:hypothetical protein
VLATADKPNYRPGERASLQLAVSNYSPSALTGITVTAAGVSAGAVSVASGDVVRTGSTPVAVTRRTTGFQTIPIDIVDNKGSALNSRELKVAVVAPVIHPAVALQLGAFTSEKGDSLGRQLAAHGYRIGNGGVLLTGDWDKQAQDFASSGGNVVVVAETADALDASARLKLKPRTGDLRGDWVSNFNWSDITRPPFALFKELGPIAGWETKNVVPRLLIDGVKPEEYDDVLSGTFFGWINDNYATTLQARHGVGRVLLTCYALSDTYGTDAYATALLDAMIAAVARKGFDAKVTF